MGQSLSGARRGTSLVLSVAEPRRIGAYVRRPLRERLVAVDVVYWLKPSGGGSSGVSEPRRPSSRDRIDQPS
jgi:hypothetical protein